MTEKRRGLGKGLGALIPSASATGRPVDVFFPDQRPAERAARGGYVALPPDADTTPSAASASGTGTTGSTRSSPVGATGRSTSTTQRTKAAGTRRTSSKRATIPADTLTPRRRSAATPAVGATPDTPAEPPAVVQEAPEATVAATRRKAAAGAPSGSRVSASSPTSAPSATTPADAPPESAESAAAPTPTPEPVTPESATPEPAAPETDDSGLVTVPGAVFAEIPVGAVVANRRQPRQIFDEEELDELAASIREVGVLQPIVVRDLPDGGEAQYELIMGERRWRASQLAGNTTVPAIIRRVEDNDLLRDALLENLHRSQLNPLEEAAAYEQLLEDFGCTHEELATRIVRSRPQISNTLRLLKLPPLVQRRVAAGVLSAGHARALLGLADAGAMERLAQRIVAEGLSVRTTEEIVALGDEPIDPELRRRPRTTAHTVELNQLATRLADRFDTRVKIGMGQRKGRINIEFASVEDLNRILDVLAPDVDRVPAQPES